MSYERKPLPRVTRFRICVSGPSANDVASMSGTRPTNLAHNDVDDDDDQGSSKRLAVRLAKKVHPLLTTIITLSLTTISQPSLYHTASPQHTSRGSA